MIASIRSVSHHHGYVIRHLNTMHFSKKVESHMIVLQISVEDNKFGFISQTLCDEFVDMMLKKLG